MHMQAGGPRKVASIFLPLNKLLAVPKEFLHRRSRAIVDPGTRAFHDDATVDTHFCRVGMLRDCQEGDRRSWVARPEVPILNGHCRFQGHLAHGAAADPRHHLSQSLPPPHVLTDV